MFIVICYYYEGYYCRFCYYFYYRYYRHSRYFLLGYSHVYYYFHIFVTVSTVHILFLIIYFSSYGKGVWFFFVCFCIYLIHCFLKPYAEIRKCRFTTSVMKICSLLLTFNVIANVLESFSAHVLIPLSLF